MTKMMLKWILQKMPVNPILKKNKEKGQNEEKNKVGDSWVWIIKYN